MTTRAGGDPGAELEATRPDCGDGTVGECVAQPADVTIVMSSVTSAFTRESYTKPRSGQPLACVSLFTFMDRTVLRPDGVKSF
jgi:hypothetical protein